MTKRQLANQMLTKKDREKNIPVFFTNSWLIRAAKIKLRVIQREKRAVIRKVEREIAKEKGVEVEYSIK